jgi:hypothetical protein
MSHLLARSFRQQANEAQKLAQAEEPGPAPAAAGPGYRMRHVATHNG